MTFSFTMHTFWIKSKCDFKCFMGLDFAGIAILVSGSTMSAVWYIANFMPFIRNIYISLMVIFFIATIFVTNLSFFNSWEGARAIVYVAQAGVSFIPMVHWIIQR
jgi:predicted membrane channel-forming protein YqfA (hemolysin III family)